MCILTTGRISSLEHKNDATLPWSICGVDAFSIFPLFIGLRERKREECGCLSYFMCHWLPQSVVKNVLCVCKASSCLLRHSFPLPHFLFCCLTFSPLIFSHLHVSALRAGLTTHLLESDYLLQHTVLHIQHKQKRKPKYLHWKKLQELFMPHPRIHFIPCWTIAQ